MVSILCKSARSVIWFWMNLHFMHASLESVGVFEQKLDTVIWFPTFRLGVRFGLRTHLFTHTLWCTRVLRRSEKVAANMMHIHLSLRLIWNSRESKHMLVSVSSLLQYLVCCYIREWISPESESSSKRSYMNASNVWIAQKSLAWFKSPHVEIVPIVPCEKWKKMFLIKLCNIASRDGAPCFRLRNC